MANSAPDADIFEAFWWYFQRIVFKHREIRAFAHADGADLALQSQGIGAPQRYGMQRLGHA